MYQQISHGKTGKLIAQANIRECSEEVASIVREEGYPETPALSVLNLEESLASADPAELTRSAHGGQISNSGNLRILMVELQLSYRIIWHKPRMWL